MTCRGRLKSFFRRFGRTESGTVLVLMALSLLPVMMIVGGFVDYARALRARGQLEAATDAGILSAQLQYSQDNSVDYQGVLSDYLAKNLSDSGKAQELQEVTVDDVHLTEEGEMIASVSGKVKMTFLSLLGIDDMTISAETAARVGGSAIEVALVLDNTGSMRGTKIDALKAAATDLVTAIMIKDDDPKVKFALVPFADYVKLNAGDRYEMGLDIPDDYSYTPTGTHCWNNYPDSTRTCTPITTTGTCYNDGVPYSCTQTTGWDCTGDLGDPVEQCDSYATENYKWYGCMGSRPHDLNVRDEDYGTQGVPGIMSTWDNCSYISPITRLTSNRGSVTSGLNAMQSEGMTYIPAGLAWGWRALSNGAPFSEGVPAERNLRKVIVLMTDGANTRSMSLRTGNSVINHEGSPIYQHSGSDVANANQMTAELCSNIKNADIMLYTISFDVAGDTDIQNLLSSCAGNGGRYYNADDTVELADAFRQIGLSLLNLRLSK